MNLQQSLNPSPDLADTRRLLSSLILANQLTSCSPFPHICVFVCIITEQSHLNLFANRPQPKKKRKSRTAFTNHQIFELEKRFLYQKYLSPSDRDEIAAALGLSNAQVGHGTVVANSISSKGFVGPDEHNSIAF